MSKTKSFGAPEPTVIDEELIRVSLREADRIALEYDEVPANPPYHLSDIPKLSLSFRSKLVEGADEWD